VSESKGNRDALGAAAKRFGRQPGHPDAIADLMRRIYRRYPQSGEIPRQGQHCERSMRISWAADAARLQLQSSAGTSLSLRVTLEWQGQPA